MKLAGQGDDRDRAPIARRFRRPFHAQAFKPPSRRRTAHLPSLVVSTVRFTIAAEPLRCPLFSRGLGLGKRVSCEMVEIA
jgi:hypothetical protein